MNPRTVPNGPAGGIHATLFPNQSCSLTSPYFFTASFMLLVPTRNLHGESPNRNSLSLSQLFLPSPFGVAKITGVFSNSAMIVSSNKSSLFLGAPQPYTFRKIPISFSISLTPSTTLSTPFGMLSLECPLGDEPPDGLTRSSLGVLSLIRNGRVAPGGLSPMNPSCHSTKAPSGLLRL